jgi:hypothetical protein
VNSLTTSIATLTAATAVALLATPLAPAKDGDILRAGTCTGATNSKLKLSDEDGRIEVEFEVDQNRNGVRWVVAIRQGGQLARQLVRVTRGPSGSFEARLVLPNRPGGDRIAATATRSGERCTAAATFA